MAESLSDVVIQQQLFVLGPNPPFPNADDMAQ